MWLSYGIFCVLIYIPKCFVKNVVGAFFNPFKRGYLAQLGFGLTLIVYYYNHN